MLAIFKLEPIVDVIWRRIPLRFALYIALLVFAYINNVIDIADRTREINTLKQEIHTLNDRSTSTSATLMNISKQSQVLERIKKEKLGLSEMTTPPRIIE